MCILLSVRLFVSVNKIVFDRKFFMKTSNFITQIVNVFIVASLERPLMKNILLDHRLYDPCEWLDLID